MMTMSSFFFSFFSPFVLFANQSWQADCKKGVRGGDWRVPSSVLRYLQNMLTEEQSKDEVCHNETYILTMLARGLRPTSELPAGTETISLATLVSH